MGCGGGWPSFDYDYMDHWPGRYVWARHDDHDNNILFSEDHECRAMFTGISWSLTRDNFSIYVGGEDVQQTGRQPPAPPPGGPQPQPAWSHRNNWNNQGKVNI